VPGQDDTLAQALQYDAHAPGGWDDESVWALQYDAHAPGGWDDESVWALRREIGRRMLAAGSEQRALSLTQAVP